MNNLQRLEAIMQANSLTNHLYIYSQDNNRHFHIVSKIHQHTYSYGNYAQSMAFINGFHFGLIQNK